MFKGTEKHPPGEFSNVVAELGGQENAFTSYDYTAYYQRVAKEHLETDDGVRGRPHARPRPDRRRGRTGARRRARGAPHAHRQRARRACSARQSPRRCSRNHPYGMPVIGWMHEIEELNREDALAFYRRFYTPEQRHPGRGRRRRRPTRCASSPRRPTARSRRAAEAPVRTRPQEPDPRAARRVSLADPKVEQPSLAACLAGALLSHRRSPARRKPSTCSSQILGAQSTGACIAGWSWRSGSPLPPAAGIRALPSTARASMHLSPCPAQA